MTVRAQTKPLHYSLAAVIFSKPEWYIIHRAPLFSDCYKLIRIVLQIMIFFYISNISSPLLDSLPVGDWLRYFPSISNADSKFHWKFSTFLRSKWYRGSLSSFSFGLLLIPSSSEVKLFLISSSLSHCASVGGVFERLAGNTMKPNV